MTEQIQPGPASFAADIKPLFRARDRASMTFMFDLWEYEDVRENADAILASLEGGEMPCDGVWPPEQVALVRSWIADGCPA